MTREDFKAHVEETIENVILEAEKRVNQQLARRYCFNWIAAKTEPVPQEQVAEFITQQVYVDSEHIYPCFDIGVGEVLDDGCLLLVGYRAGYPPRPWQKNWTGSDGPFVHIMGQKFLDKYPPQVLSDQQRALRAEIVRLAAGILDRTIDVTDGVRRLIALRSHLGTGIDSELAAFDGINSETDRFPIGEVRSHWNSEALARYDAERHRVEEHYREFAERACRNLIQKYQSTT